MEIDQRLPDLSDRDLEQLHANAVRLAQTGSPKQRQKAEELLPLSGAELERRAIARESEKKTKRRSSAKRGADVAAGADSAPE